AELRMEMEQHAGLNRQLEAQQARAEASARRQQQAASLQQDLQEIESLLKPFTSPGHCQPASAINAWDWDRTVEAQPISLSKLRGLGALEKTPKGLEALFIVGGAKARGASHDRPLGSFPQFWSGHLFRPEVLAAVERAQDLLNQHGEALIDRGLLTE
ncbi:MAG: hypothetical protein KDA51_11440, partial [Planctomycetales bacterium]|nr:hypothetical protein [Planctomycetales bacterium]